MKFFSVLFSAFSILMFANVAKSHQSTITPGIFEVNGFCQFSLTENILADGLVMKIQNNGSANCLDSGTFVNLTHNEEMNYYEGNNLNRPDEPMALIIHTDDWIEIIIFNPDGSPKVRRDFHRSE